jgi:1,2-phenylacetyl-CoA epoxidase catalytic subunit
VDRAPRRGARGARLPRRAAQDLPPRRRLLAEGEAACRTRTRGHDRGGDLELSRTQALIRYADDELILGWRDSEWTGIAPSLEEDVAFSSIAQNEIGHARALYELAARDLDTTADELAFDRDPSEYRCAPLVELRRLDWAHTIARHWLYETADELRLAALKESDDPEVAGLAAKMDREEVYHRLHAQMWADRLRDEPRFQEAVAELWPYALGVLDEELRAVLAGRVGLRGSEPRAHDRGEHSDELRPLWEEMTMVRRSIPGATW